MAFTYRAIVRKMNDNVERFLALFGKIEKSETFEKEGQTFQSYILSSKECLQAGGQLAYIANNPFIEQVFKGTSTSPKIRYIGEVQT